jgi:hypothetical protein
LANLTIPDAYAPAFGRLILFDAKQIDALISALDSLGTKPASLPEPLVAALKGTPPTQIREILAFINSLYVLRAAQDVPLERFVEALAGSIEAAREGLSGENPLSGDRLKKLLNIDSLTVTAKANALLTDHDHVFCSARIYTDRRDVFPTDPEQEPIGTVIYHTLKLTYFDTAGDHENIYLVLDSSDVSSLKSILERAEHKEKTIQKQLDSHGVRRLNPPARGR